jgi:hypothetical protein
VKGAGSPDPAIALERISATEPVRREVMTRGRRAWSRRGARRAERNDEPNTSDVCEDGRTVDALAITADEGRGHAAKRPGEVLATGDPGESEWGNPPDDWSGADLKE